MVKSIAGEAGHIVISADSHTEGLVDLKPYLEATYHERFDEGLAIAKETFTKGVGFFFNMVESLAITHVEDDDSMALYELPEMERFHHGDFDAQPSVASSRSHALRTASSSGPPMSLPLPRAENSPTRCSANHVRTSSPNSSSSALKVKATAYECACCAR
jgi:hypothetical protein